MPTRRVARKALADELSSQVKAPAKGKARGRAGPPTRPASDKRPGKPRFFSSQREQFCRLIAFKGYIQAEAYREAYQSDATDKTCAEEASRLMNDPEVAARIAKLQEPLVKRGVVTLEGHLEKLAELRDAAYLEGEFGPAITAEHLRGKVTRLYVEQNVNADTTYEDLIAGTWKTGPASGSVPPKGKAGRSAPDTGHEKGRSVKPRPVSKRKTR